MKPTSLVAIALIALLLSGCSGSWTRMSRNTRHLNEDEKHRLYSAALAASDAPLDNETFKDVCRQIGIFDNDGRPNGQYMSFVSQHVIWGTTPEIEQFRQEINSREKARDYLKRHLSAAE
jgi:type II secretory pathway pseudopilin PulG